MTTTIEQERRRRTFLPIITIPFPRSSLRICWSCFDPTKSAVARRQVLYCSTISFWDKESRKKSQRRKQWEDKQPADQFRNISSFARRIFFSFSLSRQRTKRGMWKKTKNEAKKKQTISGANDSIEYWTVASQLWPESSERGEQRGLFSRLRGRVSCYLWKQRKRERQHKHKQRQGALLFILESIIWPDQTNELLSHVLFLSSFPDHFFTASSFLIFTYFFLSFSFLSFFLPFNWIMSDCSNKSRAIDSSLSSSSASPSLHPQPPSPSRLPVDVLTYVLGFLSLPELSRASRVNHDWHGSALVILNNKIELQLTAAMLDKGFGVLLLSNRCTHLQQLILSDFDGHNEALVTKLVAGLSHTPALTHLELSRGELGQSLDPNDHKLGISVLAPVLALLPLEHLDLSKNSFPHIPDSLSSLLSLPSLHHLNLSSCSLGDSSLPALGSCLMHLSQLHFLSLPGNDLSKAPASFFSSLQHLSNLQHLDLMQTRIGRKASELAALLPHLTQLHHLDIRNNDLRDADFLLLFPSMDSLSSLQSLDLSENHLSLASVASFSSICPHLSSLQQLWLDRVSFHDTECVALATALSQLPTLTRLSLCECNTTTSGFAHIAAVFPCLPSLRMLNIADNDISFSSLHFRFPSSLTHLFGGGNRADEHNMIAFCDALLSLSHLGVLYMSQIDTTAMAYFSASLRHLPFASALTMLDLENSSLRNLGIGFLASAFRYLPSLVKLSLQSTWVTDEGLPFLSSQLHHLLSLELLNLSGNEITSAGILLGTPSFVAALATLPRLRKLIIHANALPEIRTRFPRLIAEYRWHLDDYRELATLYGWSCILWWLFVRVPLCHIIIHIRHCSFVNFSLWNSLSNLSVVPSSPSPCS